MVVAGALILVVVGVEYPYLLRLPPLLLDSGVFSWPDWWPSSSSFWPYLLGACWLGVFFLSLDDIPFWLGWA